MPSAPPSEGKDQVRGHLWTKSALALGLAISLCVAFGHQSTAQAAGDGAGDFIVRCFFNGNVLPEDPILGPGSFHTDHLHSFFGNMAQGGAASNGTAFPNMRSGDGGASGTMEQNGLSPATNCQDTKDTAGYWIPQPFKVTSGLAATPLFAAGQGCSNSCSASTNFHQRVYYIPQGTQTNQEIPDGTIMINGYPDGCTTDPGLPTPDGCTNSPPTSYPQDQQVVEYSCGANQGAHIATPLSMWPYDCTHYVGKDGDDSYSDGAVALVKFPYCWDGNATGHFPAPNAGKDANGLPTAMVPGYIAPWIPYEVWHTIYSMPARPVNDFAYPMPGTGCSNSVNAPYTHTVVQLQERIHLLTFGQGWGPPSSCVGDGGIKWNDATPTDPNRNAEMSTQPNPNDTGDGDGDANVQLAPGLWGTWLCQSAQSPSPDAGATTLSFACSHGGDPNCNIGLSSPTGCVAAGGTCYAGAYKWGWETLHADYWQTWQEASSNNGVPNGNLDNTLVNGQLTDGVSGDVGTFGDVVEDCTSGSSGRCTPSFIVTKQNSPSQVYNPPNNP